MNIVIKLRETFCETISIKRMAKALVCAFFCANSMIYAQSCMEKKSKICVKNVEVTVDSIQEKGISLQILEIAKTALNARKFCEKAGLDQFDDNYTLTINLRERSFFKNIENARSIYTHYQLFSESGECVAEKVFCSESKNSILSALTQEKEIQKIAKDLKKYFLAGSKDDA